MFVSAQKKHILVDPLLRLTVYMYFADGHHGNRGSAHGLGQSSSPSGALFHLGHAGLGLLHRRYEAHKHGGGSTSLNRSVILSKGQ